MTHLDHRPSLQVNLSSSDSNSGSNSDFGTVLAPRNEVKLQKPKMYKVLLHNDDRTPRQFVVEVLRICFLKNENASVDIMMKAHRDGVSIVGIYALQIAETRVEKALTMAEQFEFPLLFTIDEVDGDD